MKQQLAVLISTALKQLQAEQVLSLAAPVEPLVERTRDSTHGDFACNIALGLAKFAGMKPRDLAARIVAALPPSDQVEKVEVAGPGFINFFLATTAIHGVVAEILKAGELYGRSMIRKGERVQVEFVSANPTGPLHVGHGRGAALGDCICRLLEAVGCQVTREFYYNDAGQQINNLALSVQARCKGFGPDDAGWPEDGYRGDYIVDVARAYMNSERMDAEDKHVTGAANADDLDAIREFAVAYLRREQDEDLRAFDVHFDVYFLESSLYTSGAVVQTVNELVEHGHTYEQDGALWLKTTDFGDDKDRVMRKSDGSYTYFVPDVAYHVGKWKRGFTRVINEQGADHHGTVARVRAGLQALEMGIPQGWPEYVLHQMVLVMRGGEEVKISKRAGGYVTLRDLIDEVGRDATRYFLVARSPSSQLTFDIDLAVSQSNDNPVYYIQYAHARISSVMRQLSEKGLRYDEINGLAHLQRLQETHEQALMNRLGRFPEILESAALSYEPHQLAHYLRELANDFHVYYNAQQFLVDDAELRNARLALVMATRQVIANGLSLLGLSAPESM